MRSLTYAWIVAALAVVVVGCSPSDKGGSDSKKETAAAKSPAAPTGEKPTGELEVPAFKGGYDIDFYARAAGEFEQKNPGLKINVWGNPRVWEQLKPRMLSDDQPGLMFPGWDMDHWRLAYEGGLMTLDSALDSPAYNSTKKWRDTFDPKLLALGKLDGVQYVLPFYFNIEGWWYNPDQFKANGWTPPKTYDELLDLCEKIKAKGIAPITFQGKYPYYMIDGMLFPWAQSIGGIEAINDAQNLTPGAWKSPAILQAATMICELRDKGDFQNGAVGMSHTESQTQFVQGKAAMIPCGTWLKSEMSKEMPANTRIQFLVPPAVKGGKGDPTALIIGIEPWMVPSKGKNANAGIAFYKYMTSVEKAKEFVIQKGTLTAIIGSDDGVKLPDTLVEPARAFKATKTAYSTPFKDWYKDFEKEVENALTSMLNKQLTPQQFCDRCEEEAEKTRNKSSIPKHKVSQ